MAISKENLNVYISLSKKDGKQTINVLLISETKRRELLGRLSQIYTSACKGIKLSYLDIGQISLQNEKMARDFLTALFGSNACDGRLIDFSDSGNAKTMLLLQTMLSTLAPLFKNQKVILYADPQNLRLNQLQTALKKAGLQASVQAESWKDSPGLQTSRFLGDLYLCGHIPQARGQLQRELAYEKRFIRQDGDAVYLKSIIPASMQKAYENLQSLPAPVLESWAKKGASLRALENAAALLAEGFSPQEVAGCSASKLSRPLEELKKMPRHSSKEQTSPKESSSPSKVSAKEGKATRSSAEKPGGIQQGMETPGLAERNKERAEIKKNSTSLNAVLKDWSAYAQALQRQTGDDLRAAEASSLQNGVALRVGMQERLLRLYQKQPTMDVWIREQGSTLEILVSEDKETLLHQIDEKDKGGPDPELFRIYRFKGDTFRLRLQTLLAWMSGLGRRYFLHLPAYMETEWKRTLLEQNWMIPMAFETIDFPESQGIWIPESGSDGKRSYLPQKLSAALSEEAIRVLALPDLSISLTKLLAHAFFKGLNPGEAETIYHNTDGRLRQERMRSLAGQFVFTTAMRRKMDELLDQQVDLLLWDFLSAPSLSYARRQLILEAVERGWSLEQIRHTITARSTTSAMQKALQGEPKELSDEEPSDKKCAVMVKMPRRVREDLESWAFAQAANLEAKRQPHQKNTDSRSSKEKIRKKIQQKIQFLEQNPRV